MRLGASGARRMQCRAYTLDSNEARRIREFRPGNYTMQRQNEVLKRRIEDMKTENKQPGDEEGEGEEVPEVNEATGERGGPRGPEPTR